SPPPRPAPPRGSASVAAPTAGVRGRSRIAGSRRSSALVQRGSAHSRLVGGVDVVRLTVGLRDGLPPTPSTPARIHRRQPLVVRLEIAPDIVDQLQAALSQAIDLVADRRLLL